ncbi:hypothetical protein ABG79_00437 [Caloramator mitchellensis]|uniref:DUF2325 domain-containing protein n=1 Tax=Caloramator mitchellensis TaxID=908809 RepID=A0A0R3K2J5_CALMK|nr:DUF2325 domain-containing protein [Caloramator mitchellensis]KRQ87636.1 hypothetical protein ABG79_00437 [Caloramator mitchellensis]
MSALIIGGDKVQTIIKGLRNKGFNEIKHISGRKPCEKVITSLLKLDKYDIILVLTDYVNHCLCTNLKNKTCKCKNCNVIYCKRSWPLIEEKLTSFSLEV